MKNTPADVARLQAKIIAPGFYSTMPEWYVLDSVVVCEPLQLIHIKYRI
jgi:hypothetical protein